MFALRVSYSSVLFIVLCLLVYNVIVTLLLPVSAMREKAEESVHMFVMLSCPSAESRKGKAVVDGGRCEYLLGGGI
jgi:hypothetical protein